MSKLRVDSRWWYWVAAVPLVTAFWVASSMWVAVVVLVVPEAVLYSAESVVSIPAVALGVPALVAFAMLPLAFWMDARAIAAAGGDWPADTGRFAKLGSVVAAVAIGGAALFFDGISGQGGVLGVGAVLLGVAVLAGSWLCVRYLRKRGEHVAMPSTLGEWREELRAEEAVR